MAGITNHAYTPHKRSVQELLILTNPAIVVPDWQRNYSWRHEHFETFWTDLVRFSDRTGDSIKDEYFFGSVVLVEGDENLLLLDGQQRLATSTILLSAIRNKLANVDGKTSEYIQNQFLSSENPIEKKVVHRLRLNVYDRDFFQRLISDERGEGYQPPEPSRASHFLIADALKYFEQSINERINGKSEAETREWLLRILNVLCVHFTVIAAYSTNEDNAAEVFETLNDRGIGLSTPDLLRNLVIRRAAENEQEQIVERWESVISFQTDTEIKAFLRHYWISKHGDVKSQSLYREVKSTIEAQNISSIVLSTELSDAAKLYRNLRGGEYDNEEIAEILGDIRGLGAGAAILYPAMLSIFETLEPDQILVALTALLNLYVRDGIIGGIENSILENKFHRAARNLRDSKSAVAFCAEIAVGALTDDEVRGRFQRLSLSNQGQRRYILYSIEMAKRGTGELAVNAPSKVHVEHIYPQTPQAGARWANHDRVINRIGNLSLLDKRINAAIKNGGFAAKKPHYSASEILMTQELVGLDDWNEDRIAVRQEAFSHLVSDIWPIVQAN
ncbi:DUF262 domain-containing protein [Sphingopyxis granuli]|uniref:DUF262 domain-containing protein n=1 Tax=Sphingopyxis granuli TaxID=267128 RepID=UPI001BAFDDE2|nr:DUF262 domain-containing protein [Sphingopyxis granuli]QUM73669.1 DUF262 domain-containing protein [Sphingopyxis granuli]